MGYTWKTSRSAEMLKFDLFSSERKNSAQLPFSIHRYFKTYLLKAASRHIKKVLHMRFFHVQKIMHIQKHGLEFYVLLDGSKKPMLSFVEQSLALITSCSDFR